MFFGGVNYRDPPVDISGESRVFLDCRGNLILFHVIPPEEIPSPAGVQSTDFSSLFQEAGLDAAKWTSAEPLETPPFYADRQAAWTGVLPDRPNVLMRVEAAAYRGKPVWWRLKGPWTLPFRKALAGSSWSEIAANLGFYGLIIVVLLGAVLLARRNLRMGRGDKRGAVRLAYFSCVLSGVAWVFGEHHVATIQELYLFSMFVSWTLSLAGIVWLLYIALEPWVRRRWPNVLVGWSRLLAASLRDPLVGRDLLAGCAGGTILVLFSLLQPSLISWAGFPPPQPQVTNLDVFLGNRAIIKIVADVFALGLLTAFGCLFGFFLLRVLLRREWAAVTLFVLIATSVNTLGRSSGLSSGAILVIATMAAISGGVGIFVLLRFGLLAFATSVVFTILSQSFPITTQLSSWYFGIGLTGLVLLLALTGYGFYTSLGGQPILGRAALED